MKNSTAKKVKASAKRATPPAARASKLEPSEQTEFEALGKKALDQFLKKHKKAFQVLARY